MKIPGMAVMLVLLAGGQTHGEIITQEILYQQGGTRLAGLLAYDDARTGPRPGLLVAPDWMGPSEFTTERARRLAALGYAVLVLDMYGPDARPHDAQAARRISERFKSDRALTRARAAAALEVLRARPTVDPRRLAAMGYCFGGMVVLELARSGAGLAGVASFHGELDTPEPGDAKNIRGKVLILHGADDPRVPPEQVAAFEREMRAARVDWQMNVYGNAVHSFTNPRAGSDPARGSAYNAEADRRSWQALRDFLAELFPERPAAETAVP